MCELFLSGWVRCPHGDNPWFRMGRGPKGWKAEDVSSAFYSFPPRAEEASSRRPKRLRVREKPSALYLVDPSEIRGESPPEKWRGGNAVTGYIFFPD